MASGVVCSRCGKIVEKICAFCWRCNGCCDCKIKSGRTINGYIGKTEKVQSKKKNGKNNK